jgi:hypothetical protein
LGPKSIFGLRGLAILVVAYFLPLLSHLSLEIFDALLSHQNHTYLSSHLKKIWEYPWLPEPSKKPLNLHHFWDTQVSQIQEMMDLAKLFEFQGNPRARTGFVEW